MKKIILSFILLSSTCLNLTGCEKVEAYKIKIDEMKKNQEKEDEEILPLNLDDEIILDHYNGGKYSLTFKDVKRTDKRNEFASSDINDVIIIDYKFENYSVNEDIIASEGIDFKVYDQNKNLLTTYPIIQSIKYPTPSSPGMISSGSIALGSKDILNKIYIVVYNQELPIGYIALDIEN